MQRDKKISIKFGVFISDNQLHLVAVTETWFNDNDHISMSRACPPGYSLLTENHKGRRGGMAIIYRNYLKVCKLDIQKYETFENIQVLVQSPGITGLLVSTVYRPPPNKTNEFTFSDFCNEFSDLLDNLSLQKHWLLLCGDCNIHVDDPNNKQASEFKQLTQPYGLKHIMLPCLLKIGYFYKVEGVIVF